MIPENKLNSESISIIQKKPYVIFKIKNFLNEDLYNEIKKNYPYLESKNNNKNFNYNFINKYDKTKKFNELLDKEECLKKFDNYIESSSFFKFITKNLYLYSALSQNNFLKKIKYLRPIKKNVGKKSFFDFLTSKISIKYDYTSIFNNGYKRPHVDALRKYVSLLLYFPSDEHDDNEYGTTFWISKIKNYSNTHLLNDKDYEDFKKNNELIYKTFEENCLYGFIRNDLSWHSVEPVNISKDYVRRCITINLIYDN